MRGEVTLPAAPIPRPARLGTTARDVRDVDAAFEPLALVYFFRP